MDIEKNKEKIKLQFDIIKRTDGYIATTNNKAALLLAVNGATATIISNKVDAFAGLFQKNGLYTIVFFLLLFMIAVFIFMSVLRSLGSIMPNMNGRKGKGDSTESNVSFVYISSNNNGKEYYKKYLGESEDGLLLDMCEQSFILAYIAKQKFLCFSSAVSWIKRAYICIILLVIFKFIDYVNGVLL
ncbi:hypothetical protein K2480_003873 [Salmonella enterica]|nr:hypothetical protein [Salmonella enterica]EBS3061526.1 hypothetical protein [Salmonella enterica subsp. enterica serovar Litchfield]EED4848492.1 hypothetical protein [Salmonella enterica subsp. enterica serovar Newport]HAE1275931.1 hypothetical protein [Salmonella enterica subsp. houtenae]EBI8449653.1 hypothetical protein [Salmonella enterica]